jgi:GDPmannose 4,6-dehydratase
VWRDSRASPKSFRPLIRRRGRRSAASLPERWLAAFGEFRNNPPSFESIDNVKRAFITGIAGQDGSYLAELLLEKNYEVHGLVHGVNGLNAPRLQHLICNETIFNKRLFLYPGDLDAPETISSALQKAAPHEVYHLAGESHVGKSFEAVEQTCELTVIGTLRLLETVRNLPERPRFFNASSSEIFGSPEQMPQTETTPFSPVTPYGCAKTFATNLTRVYRKVFGVFAVNGICFNHESPRRGENFVTRKICRAAAAIKLGKQKELVLGDTSAQRDWGYAPDYVRGMWLALQYDTAEDFMFATGKLHSVQNIIEIAFRIAGLDWKQYVRCEQQLFRPADPHRLVGNAAKAKKLLGWEPKTSFEEIIVEMTHAELNALRAP